MGSAKTAMLLTTAYNFEERGMSYLCFKPSIDTREKKNVIRSRIGIERECQWIYRDTDLFALIRDMVDGTGCHPEWILVDEAQFLAAEQVDQLARVVDNYGINVICYGLHVAHVRIFLRVRGDCLRLRIRLMRSNQRVTAGVKPSLMRG